MEDRPDLRSPERFARAREEEQREARVGDRRLRAVVPAPVVVLGGQEERRTLAVPVVGQAGGAMHSWIRSRVADALDRVEAIEQAAFLVGASEVLAHGEVVVQPALGTSGRDVRAAWTET